MKIEKLVFCFPKSHLNIACKIIQHVFRQYAMPQNCNCGPAVQSKMFTTPGIKPRFPS